MKRVLLKILQQLLKKHQRLLVWVTADWTNEIYLRKSHEFVSPIVWIIQVWNAVINGMFLLQEKEIKDLNEMLVDAGNTFHQKEEEIAKLKSVIAEDEEKMEHQVQ